MNKDYHVIGLMSGTSLDGVDLAYCSLTYENENWIYKILNTNTFPYTPAWEQRLTGLMAASATELIATDHLYGRYLGELVQRFIREHDLQPDFIASHGHTVFHEPERHISLQVGNGAYLAAAAGYPVVCDFRTGDIALGGQGAPLVPIGDQLLFRDYDFCLNLGGIANISFETENRRLAYDTGACNMLLNVLAGQVGKPYDENGNLARSGHLLEELIRDLNAPDYFKAPFPKSLGKEWVDRNSLAVLLAANGSVADKLHTACCHIAFQVGQAVRHSRPGKGKKKLLVTGGGALNQFLVTLIREELAPDVDVVVPDTSLVNFKEALIFAFLGVLRWRGEVNCLQTVTGARADHVGGAIYLP